MPTIYREFFQGIKIGVYSVGVIDALLLAWTILQ